MLAWHALIVHLDHRVDPVAQVADRVEGVAILRSAGHPAVWPPHQRQRWTCVLNGTAPDGLVAPDLNAGTIDGLVGAGAERDRDFDGFRRAPCIPDQSIFEQCRGW